MKIIPVAILAAGLGLAGCAGAPAAHPLTTHLGSTAASVVAPAVPSPTRPHGAPPVARHRTSSCDSSLWREIYHAYRLHVVAACKTVVGTVDDVRAEPDGDVHIRLALQSSQAHLLNAANIADQHGDLVVEIICYGTITQADAVAACADHGPQVPEPAAGQRVKITGSYVLDADHGWMEIHPVSKLVVLGSPAPAPPPATPAPAVPPPPPSSAPPVSPVAACHPTTPSGNCYEAGEFCSAADLGMTGVAGDGKAIKCESDGSRNRWLDS